MATATLTRSQVKSILLIEDTFSYPRRIDRDRGVIYGVKVLGRRSRNGREYSESAMQDAARLYQKCNVNMNHLGKGGAGADLHGNPLVQAGIGWLENAHVRPDGVFADLHVLKSNPSAEMVFEAAERNPNRFGLSHHAYGKAFNRGGKTVIESIQSVRSVDLVQNPAATSGLFESVGTQALAPFRDAIDAVLNNSGMETPEKLEKIEAILNAAETLAETLGTGGDSLPETPDDADQADYPPAGDEVADDQQNPGMAESIRHRGGCVLQENTAFGVRQSQAKQSLAAMKSQDRVPAGYQGLRESTRDKASESRRRFLQSIR